MTFIAAKRCKKRLDKIQHSSPPVGFYIAG